MSETGLMDHLVFKGGTMLRKMIFGQAGRLSTDLDFVIRSIDGIVADDMALEIASVFGEDYRGMTFKLDLRDVDRTDGASRESQVHDEGHAGRARHQDRGQLPC